MSENEESNTQIRDKGTAFLALREMHILGKEMSESVLSISKKFDFLLLRLVGYELRFRRVDVWFE